MSTACRKLSGKSQEMTFDMIAEKVLSLDKAIEWFALEEAGREPRWAWRDPRTGSLCVGSANNARVADPLLFTLVEGSFDQRVSPHTVLFVVLVYDDMVQIVARLVSRAHLTVAVSPGADPYVLGRKLTSLLESGADASSRVH